MVARLLPKPRHRAYAALAAGTVALAVGVNLVVFTIVNALWVRPLPFPDSDRFVILSQPFLGLDGSVLRPFHGRVAGQVDEERLGLRPYISIHEGGPAIDVAGVTPEFFRLFGLPIFGRDFSASDNLPGAEPVAILSHRVWLRDFGGRPDAVGGKVTAGSVSIRVIGVAPERFDGVRRGDRVDIWIPSDLRRRLSPTSLNVWGVPLLVFARLPEGQSSADAEQEVNRLDPVGTRHVLVPVRSAFGTANSPTVVINGGRGAVIVSGLALLVLLGGCATLATLILVHFERRGQELATKVALGAARGRLLRELCGELAVIGTGGALGAMGIAHLALRGMPALSLPGGLDLGRLDLSIDWRVVGVALLATLVTFALSAWLPLARTTGGRLAGELLAGPASTASIASQRFRQMLLGAQVAAAVVVLASAALFVRAVIHGFGHASGFDVEHTVFVRAEVAPRYAFPGLESKSWPTMLAQRKASIREALRALPSVESIEDGGPPLGPEVMAGIEVPFLVDLNGRQQELRVGRVNTAGAGWLSALGVPILAGRHLTAADAGAKPVPTVVTASLAQRLWPGESPLGQVITGPNRTGARIVVGVAADFVVGSLLRPASGAVVNVTTLDSGGSGRWVLRAAHPNTVVEQVARAVRAAVPDVASIRVATGREVVAEDLGRQRAGAWFFSGFGIVALILGVGSTFGLVAYLAESRRREFGVRLALGATPSSLVRHGVRSAVVPVGGGVALGLLLAVWVARLFASTLVGVNVLDPLTYAGIAASILGGSTVAAVGAAWRLRRIAPMDALRIR